MSALPKRFYGDPSECVDEMRRMTERAKRDAAQMRRNKSLRIQALVRVVMKNGGGKKSK